MSITPRGMSIQEAYRLFRDDGLIVNRKYQRKLVWTKEEKQKLIDSILNDYPIPLILLAGTSIEGKQVYEIIDGMQRLNAIFSFIENAFPVNEKYFDTDQFARAKIASESGAYAAYKGSSSDFYDAAKCADILDYQLAITIFPNKSENQVTDIFGRINSGGKQLSSQEKRQAGMTDDFSMVIRELSSEIRGDASKDILTLASMPEISIDSARSKHGYALNAEKIFWCYQGILWANNLRESEDEEMILDICSSIVTKKPIERSKVYFDKIYTEGESVYESIRRDYSSYGKGRLVQEVKVTLSVLREVINGYSNERFALRNVVSPTGTNPIKETFFSIFMAFHTLIIVEEKTPIDYNGIMNAIQNLHKTIIATANTSKTENRVKNIDAVTGLIQRHFEKKNPPMLKHGAGLAIDFENSLRRSKIETTRYECKQGFYDLSTSRTLDANILSKIANTICGIANLGPDSEGYIFIGVADKKEDADRIKILDNVEPIEVGNRYVVGIDREIALSKMKTEQYLEKLLGSIRSSKLSEPLLSQVLTQVDLVQFKGLSVIRIKVPTQKALSSIGDDYFTRENSSTVEIKGPKLLAINKLFDK